MRADKLREVTDGHDGTWVAHPGLIPVAKEVGGCCCCLPAWDCVAMAALLCSAVLCAASSACLLPLLAPIRTYPGAAKPRSW